MIKLVLLRHGESEYNKKNLFTGWIDVPLTQKGINESIDAGKTLKQKDYKFDIVLTSYLKRALSTNYYCLKEMDYLWLPVEKTWRLNEKHYGALQNLSKKETAKKYGEKQVLLWRRDYNTRPPALKITDKNHPKFEEKYKDVDSKLLPSTECLKDVVNRVTPYWNKTIKPLMKQGKKILISAHGNSLRAIVKIIDKIPDDEIIHLNIPTGIPLVYEFTDALEPIKHYYLADNKTIKKLEEKIKNEGKK